MIINHVFLQRASAFLLDVLQYLSSYIGLFQIDSHIYYFPDNAMTETGYWIELFYSCHSK